MANSTVKHSIGTGKKKDSFDYTKDVDAQKLQLLDFTLDVLIKF